MAAAAATASSPGDGSAAAGGSAGCSYALLGVAASARGAVARFRPLDSGGAGAGAGIIELPVPCGLSLRPSASSSASASFPQGEPFVETGYHRALLASMVALHAAGADLCLVGPPGCGKSLLLRRFAATLGYSAAEVETVQVGRMPPCTIALPEF